MVYNPDIHHRKSIRLKGYDYSQPGLYFITICTYDKEYLFGQIENGNMHVNEFGEIVRNEWVRTSQMRPNIELGAFVVMPNHFHGIIEINDESHQKIHDYIIFNPAQWQDDEYFTAESSV